MITKPGGTSVAVEITHTDGVCLIALSGRIDSRTVPDIETEVRAATAEAKRVVLDLDAVPYLSSAGIRLLLLLYRDVRDRGGRIVLAGLSEELRDVLDMTGFLSFFEVVDDARAGLATVGLADAS